MDTPWYQYCRAVLEDGHSIISFVTTSLYKGGSRRPDVYMTDMYGFSKYQSTFTTSQKAILEKYPYIDNFNIHNTSQDYDIPLHYLLQQHVCGLANSTSSQWTKKGTLENLLTEVFDKWKTITKGYLMNMQDQELILRLKQIEKIYIGILEYLESMNGENLDKVKSFIKKSLSDKQNSQPAPKSYGTSNVAIGQRPTPGTSIHDTMGVGRVAVAGAGAGALVGAVASGIGHALFDNGDSDDVEEEEIGEDGLGKSMTSGALIGAVVGGVITGLAATNFKNQQINKMI